jgi:hypothetical protein
MLQPGDLRLPISPGHPEVPTRTEPVAGSRDEARQGTDPSDPVPRVLGWSVSLRSDDGRVLRGLQGDATGVTRHTEPSPRRTRRAAAPVLPSEAPDATASPTLPRLIDYSTTATTIHPASLGPIAEQ